MQGAGWATRTLSQDPAFARPWMVCRRVRHSFISAKLLFLLSRVAAHSVRSSLFKIKNLFPGRASCFVSSTRLIGYKFGIDRCSAPRFVRQCHWPPTPYERIASQRMSCMVWPYVIGQRLNETPGSMMTETMKRACCKVENALFSRGTCAEFPRHRLLANIDILASYFSGPAVTDCPVVRRHRAYMYLFLL